MARELLVTKDNGDQFKVEIPDNAKVTYGYFNPGQPSNPRGGFEQNQDARRACLRVKVGDSQLAAYLGVKEWRDTSLKVTRLVARVTGEEQYWQDDDGNMERNVKRNVSVQQYPDALPEQGQMS